ncbi:heme utilization/adhesion protein [gamma proteobacterium BDW918]|nr:heme utilization/adhesion protein [gamma proteobacterium BDW918]
MRQIPKFHKLVLPLAISAALVACGSDNKGSSAAPTTVAGASSKGIIIGGNVNAYPITDTGMVDKDISLAEPTTTAEDGSYSLTLNGNYVPGTAIYVEITAVDGTLMRCDLAKCGEKNFGDDYILASGFAMSATLPQASGSSVAVNITPLTDIASKLTLQKVAAGANPSAAAAGSNAQVASRLGITGGLIDQPIVDITSADAVNGANQAALEYNLKSAAAVSAALKASTAPSLEDAVANFVTQFSNGGIADREEANTDAVSLEELLEEALALIETVKTNVDGVDESVSSSSTSLTTAKTTAQSSSNTSPSQGDVPEDAGSEGLVASKAFVKQVRNLASAGVVSANQEAFAEQIDLASEAVSTDSDIVAEGLGLGLNAIASAYELYLDAPDEDKPNSVEINGITVAISESAGTVTLAVDDTVVLNETEVAIKLSAADGTVINESEPVDNTVDGTRTVSESGSATAALSVSGSAASSAVSITINEGSFSGALSYDSEWTETDTQSETGGGYSDTWDDEFTVTNIDAKLNITLAQLNSDNNVSFTGNMALKLGELTGTEVGSYSNSYSFTDWQANSNQEQYTETVTFDGFEISLSGEFSDDDGNAISASLAANIDNYSETCTQASSYSFENGGDYSYECDLNETETDYAMVSLSIVFNFDIDGVDDDVKVEFNANRTGLETGEGSLKLSYGGNQLNLVYEGGNSATLSNHNGVTMTLTETEVEEETSLSGDIKHGGTAFATISDDSGAVVIRYVDGSFETVM